MIQCECDRCPNDCECKCHTVTAREDQPQLKKWKRAEHVAAIAYQIVGALGAPARILDYFSAVADGKPAANPLPFIPDEPVEDQPRPTQPKSRFFYAAQLYAESHMLDGWGRDLLANMLADFAVINCGEAQGEAPQALCGSRFVDSHFDGMEHICQRQKGHDGACEDAEMLWKTEQAGAHPSQDAPPEKQHVCPLCGLGHIIGPARGDAFTRLQAENYTLAIQLKHYMSRCGCPADNPCWLCTDTGELISLEKSGARSTPSLQVREGNRLLNDVKESGASAAEAAAESLASTSLPDSPVPGRSAPSLPAQDAPPVHGPFMDKAADYLREWSDRYVRHGSYANIDWSGGQAQYHLANFAGRMQAGARSTPSLPAQDAALRQDSLWDWDLAIGLAEEFGMDEYNSRIAPLLRKFYRRASGSTPSPDPPPPDVQAVENARDMYFEADKSARAELARQKATYLGLLDEAAKEVNSLESTCERLREALRERELERDSYKFLRDCTRLSLERVLHNFELLLAQKPVRDADETISEARAALAPSLPTKEK